MGTFLISNEGTCLVMLLTILFLEGLFIRKTIN